jgi:hypothetical protein
VHVQDVGWSWLFACRRREGVFDVQGESRGVRRQL